MSSNNDTRNNCGCDCGEALKDHLRKCAGYGQRPPLFEGLKPQPNASCGQTMGSSGRCCPPPPPKPITIFKPQCELPPTETFTCPADCCNPPKQQQCCPPKQSCADENDNAQQQVCPEVRTTTDTSEGGNNGGKCPASKRNAKCSPPQ